MNENFDLSNAIEQLQTMLSTEDGKSEIMNMVSNFTGEGSTEATSEQSESDGFDLSNPETLHKIQSLMSLMQSQSNSGDVQLLHALRPYLKESRRLKLDRAEKLLGAAKALKLMQESGGLM